MTKVDLSTGTLSVEQLDGLLTHLPIDVSFVDPNGIVRYYSESPGRIFKRTPAVIGRHVEKCHPEKSVDKVRQILDSFAAGRKKKAQFQIELGGRYIVIRYLAVCNPSGKYIGCLEVSQDATEIRALKGEKRLLDWTE